MKNTDKNILTGIQKILKDRFRIIFEIDDNDDLSKDLLGNTWGLQARDLVYLLFDVEKAFGIKIPEQEIADGNFNTIHNIRSLISSQLAAHLEEVAV